MDGPAGEADGGPWAGASPRAGKGGSPRPAASRAPPLERGPDRPRARHFDRAEERALHLAQAAGGSGASEGPAPTGRPQAVDLEQRAGAAAGPPSVTCTSGAARVARARRALLVRKVGARGQAHRERPRAARPGTAAVQADGGAVAAPEVGGLDGADQQLVRVGRCRGPSTQSAGDAPSAHRLLERRPSNATSPPPLPMNER